MDNPLSYDEWNWALANHFFTPGAAGKPAYLQVDAETLGLAGQAAGFTPARPEESFTQAIRQKISSNHTKDPFYRFSWFGDWKKNVLNKPEVPPPFAGLLGACVLAASRMASDTQAGVSQSNYYFRLNDLLGLGKKKGQPPSFDTKVTPLWKLLNWWLDECNNGQRGTSTARPAGFANIGYPLSQCVLRDADRRKLPVFFQQEGFEPAQEIEEEEIRSALAAWAAAPSCPLSPRAKRVISSKSTSLQHAASEIVLRELEVWDGTVADTSGRQVASIELRVQMSRGGRRFSCELYPRAPEGFPGGAYSGAEDTASLQRLGEDWFSPLAPEWLHRGFEEGIRLTKDKFALSFTPPDTLALESHSELGGWVSCSRPVLGRKYLILCLHGYERLVNRFLGQYAAEGWRQAPGREGLPSGYFCFKDVEFRAPVQEIPSGFEEIAGLVPKQRTGVSLTGGLKLGRTEWLHGCEPDVSVSSGGNMPVTVYLDGSELGCLQEGNGTLPLAGVGLESGEHHVSAATESRRFTIREPVLESEAFDSRDLLGLPLLRREERILPQSIGSMPLEPEQKRGSLSISGVRVIGHPDDIPDPVREALSVRRGYKKYVVLGRYVGQVAEYEVPYEAPFWFLKKHGSLEGRFLFPVGFEPEWIVATGAQGKQHLLAAGQPQPPMGEIADSRKASTWIQLARKNYRNLRGQRKRGLWQEYRETAKRFENIVHE